MRAIDLFAGLGGFTAAARQAGVSVVWAANHNPSAVEAHAANHPETEHACQDLRQADFSRLPAFDILLASPACQGHSTASRPRRRRKHDTDRSTAWAVVDCAEVCEPRALVVENVPSFRRWPLFGVWASALETLGYELAELVLDAAEYGVPQHRRRLFVVGLRSEARRRWRAPCPTTRERPPVASTLLDPSAGGWRTVDSKPEGVRARVARGRARLGSRFLTQHVTNHPGRSLDRPIATITCASGHWHLVDGDRMRPLTVRELARGQGFADTYTVPAQQTLGTRLVGNAVPPPLAEAVIRSVREAA